MEPIYAMLFNLGLSQRQGNDCYAVKRIERTARSDEASKLPGRQCSHLYECKP